MTFTSRKGLTALLLALFLAPIAAHAHGSTQPQHGGQVQLVGETIFELVVHETGVQLFVKEEDEEIDGSGMLAKLIITTRDGLRSELQLAPAGGNRFEAKGARIPAGSTVGVMLINKATQARVAATFKVS